MDNQKKYAKKIIVALDVDTDKEALRLTEKLPDSEVFKVGLKLFTAKGPSLFEKLQRQNKKVFLDLKLHDIPNTVAGAVSMGVRHAVYMMTLHASGGKEMMERAAEAAATEASRLGTERPLLVGVTVLTSLKSEHLRSIGVVAETEGQVLRLAALAQEAGLDGVVCSPKEIELVKGECGQGFLVVAPGIRPAWAAAQDQKRILTPAQAVRKGADYIVIGRPIIRDPDPRNAFQKILDELRQC
ncbi:MAG: orotidine-5'-phosphate decarboxylase [Candidatus Aminicenantes bacterium]|jgi:orotidine-5'-phosphate decarboxylase